MIHQYKLGDCNIVLDVCSGSVHLVDEVAYDIIEMFESHEKDERSAAIREKYASREDITNEDIDAVLHTLSAREEAVIRLRFGLKDGRCHTLEEVGTEFNVTRERIRQIEAKALRKLRHPVRSNKFKDR